eukprot:scaffold4768_cov412-Prasinococcus_capsulatus_cf.AAC.26
MASRDIPWSSASNKWSGRAQHSTMLCLSPTQVLLVNRKRSSNTPTSLSSGTPSAHTKCVDPSTARECTWFCVLYSKLAPAHAQPVNPFASTDVSTSIRMGACVFSEYTSTIIKRSDVRTAARDAIFNMVEEPSTSLASMGREHVSSTPKTSSSGLVEIRCFNRAHLSTFRISGGDGSLSVLPLGSPVVALARSPAGSITQAYKARSPRRRTLIPVELIAVCGALNTLLTAQSSLKCRSS